MAKKAKRLTKRGQPKTGATPGSGKRRAERERGPAVARRSGRRTERRGRVGAARGRAGASGRETSARGAQKRTTQPALGSPPLRRRRGASENVRNTATSASRAGKAPARGRSRAGRGPEIALRDLVRGGLPRSDKAPRRSGGAASRKRAAHGMKKGATLMQTAPRHREWLGVMKPGIPKR